ncbi:hypothetical protein U1Q18_035551, partial [Sarracenia purpurea var. burkii]
VVFPKPGMPTIDRQEISPSQLNSSDIKFIMIVFLSSSLSTTSSSNTSELVSLSGGGFGYPLALKSN